MHFCCAKCPKNERGIQTDTQTQDSKKKDREKEEKKIFKEKDMSAIFSRSRQIGRKKIHSKGAFTN